MSILKTNFLSYLAYFLLIIGSNSVRAEIFSCHLHFNADSYHLDVTSDTVARQVEFSITSAYPSDTPTWVGLGLSNQDSMNGSDIIIFEYQNNEFTHKDYHGVGNQRPVEDTVQDENWSVTRMALVQANLEFTVTKQFDVQLTSENEDLPILQEPINILWAVGTMNETGAIQYHGNTRGFQKISFYAGSCDPTNASENLRGFSIWTFAIHSFLILSIHYIRAM